MKASGSQEFFIPCYRSVFILFSLISVLQSSVAGQKSGKSLKAFEKHVLLGKLMMFWYSLSKHQKQPFIDILRSSHPKVFLGKGVLKICSKFTGKHSCRSAISVKLQSNFIETTLRHGCSPINLLHIFRTPFPKNTSEGLLLCSYES